MESESYQEYVKYKKAIETEPALYDRIMTFRQAHIEFQMKVMQNQNPSFEDEKYVSSLYSSLMLNTDARNFIESEKKVLNILQTVYETLGSIDLS